MLNRIKTLASLYFELGLRWSAFRLAYAFCLRSGLIRLQTPQYKWTDRPLAAWLQAGIPSDPTAYAAWRKQNAPKFFFDFRYVMLSDSEASRTLGVETLSPAGTMRYRSGSHVSWNSQPAIAEADRLLNGELKYFSHDYHQVGFPPNWHQVPSTLPTPSSASDVYTKPAAGDGGLSKARHWSQISDDNVAARRSPWHRPPGQAWFLPKQSPRSRGLLRREEQEPSSQRHVDIKFIWEPNRFAFVYTLVRAYAVTQDEKYPQAFWQLIQDWAEHNPPNTGANWKDGQEIALRLMAWIFGFYAFIHSSSTTQLQISQFTQLIAAQAERIYQNIAYAISTRSNHTISEAFGLWLVGFLFPELKDSKKYFSLGRKLLEQEAAAQIFPDGSYSMYSLNYHRFVLQIYLYAIRLGELNQSPISNLVLQRIANSIQYISHLIDPQTGQMPAYGSNDGALVLPLNNCDFTDYRPLLQLGSVITTGKLMFDSGDWDEDVFWLCGEQALTPNPSPFGRGAGDEGETSFPHGGTYILRNTNSRVILRCTDFHSRPSHADQLHADLWIHGQEIACDAGTYLYSGEGRRWRNGLAHTSAHNTVTVDGADQMTMVSRFTWTDWAKGRVLKHSKNLWQGEHNGYKPVNHKRTVMALEGDRWLVLDQLDAKELHHYSLHWLLSDGKYGVQRFASAYEILIKYPNSKLFDSKIKIQTGVTEGEGKFSLVRADPDSTRGWRSRYYGHKEPAISLLLEANQPRACFWTFFGFENDTIELFGDILRVNGSGIKL